MASRKESLKIYELGDEGFGNHAFGLHFMDLQLVKNIGIFFLHSNNIETNFE